MSDDKLTYEEAERALVQFYGRGGRLTRTMLDNAPTRTQGADEVRKSCQTGYQDICKAALRDGVCCPDDECDIDSGMRTGADDAQPVAIYQSRLHTDDEGTWSDCYEATFYACKAYPDKYGTRIVYATRDAAPRQPATDGEIDAYAKWNANFFQTHGRIPERIEIWNATRDAAPSDVQDAELDRVAESHFTAGNKLTALQWRMYARTVIAMDRATASAPRDK